VFYSIFYVSPSVDFVHFLAYLFTASWGKAVLWRLISNDIQQDKHTFALGVLPLAPAPANHFTYFDNDSSVFQSM